MLRELHIQNLAVIDEARIELVEGLNCFTGQTGAGKSLVIGAFELLLGMRAGSEMVRAGQREACVTGLFEVRDSRIASQIREVIDAEVQEGDELLISRRVGAAGRSSVSVNGRLATAAMVRAVGQLLVDVHGQHDHQFLLKAANQLQVLDAFGDCLDQSERLGKLITTWRGLVRKRESASQEADLRDRQRELLQFQIEEIDLADPQAGEWAELQARHGVLANLKKIGSDASAAYAALHESEGSIVERLQMMSHLLADLAQLDPRLVQTAEQIHAATSMLQDGAFDLRQFLDRLDLDPSELGEVEERLDVLNRLVARYGDGADDEDPVARVLDHRDEMARQLDQLQEQDEEAGGLEGHLDDLGTQIRTLARRLGARRRKAAARLVPLVCRELRELGMAEASFDMAFEARADDQVPCDLEDVQMLVRANPGQPARPLRKVASGGEMSRIMLGIKSVLSTADRVSVLVFDEVDSNVGGRMGTVIGRKLKRLAGSGQGDGRHQVLCITHLPQIAAFADRHVHITKQVTGKGARRNTSSQITVLAGRDRVAELAEMLAGRNATATTRKQAKEMLELAVGS